MTVLTAYLVVSTIDSRRVNRQLLAVLLINVTVDVFKTSLDDLHGRAILQSTLHASDVNRCAKPPEKT